MTRLLTTGWETGDLSEVGTGGTTGANGAVSVVSSTPTPRGGSYAFKLAFTGSGGAVGLAPTFRNLPLSASKTEVWLRFAVYTTGLRGLEFALATWLDSAGAAQTSLTYSPVDGLLRLYRGTATGTLFATSSSGFTQDGWRLVEWRTQHLTTTTGAAEVWVNGTQVLTFSGDTSNTSTVNVLTLQLGCTNNIGTAGTATGMYLAFDDIAVNDTAGSLNNGRPGDGRIVLLTPNGAGSSTALTRGGTDTGANYSQVSELPPSMSQYVYSATATTRDLYALSDLVGGVTSINTAEVLALVQNSDAGAGSIGLTVKSGGTTNEATAQTLGASSTYIRQQYETDPATSAAWTSSAINALEAGVTVR